MKDIISAAIMIDRGLEDKMQQNYEASPGCLIDNASSCYNSQESVNAVQGFPEHKSGENGHVSESVEVDNPVSWEPYTPSNQVYNSRPFHRQEAHALPYVHPDFAVFRQSQMNSFRNNFYPMNQDYPFPRIENKFHCMPPVKIFSTRAYPCEVQDQEFQYFVVIDFEATCDKERNPHPQEIIEFPSVLVNSTTGQLEASFQTYVRPVYHQHLTDFCKELTGIQQIQVDRGVPLSEAILMHDKWLEDKGIKHRKFAVVTWSNWDCHVMLESECRFKRIRKPPYFNRWINLKIPFQERFRGARCNLKDAVQLAGLTWEGRAHCGLDDARNTARLLVFLMRQGIKFSITNSLMWQTSDFPIKYHSFRDFLLDQNQQSQKPKEIFGPVQFHPFIDPTGKERCNYCFCGVLSSRCVVRKPGPTQGRCFFGCGNWSATRRAVCNYFMWASS